MNTKILLGGVSALVIVIVIIFALLPGSGIVKNIVPPSASVPTSLTAVSTVIKPIDISYNGSSVLNSTETDARVRSDFYVTNPNHTTVILEAIDYSVYANGLMVGHGSVGQRFQGTWDSSYYYPLISGISSNISGMADLKNTGNYPDVWNALGNGTAKIRVSGTVYYATKTAFSGNDFTEDFNFTNP